MLDYDLQFDPIQEEINKLNKQIDEAAKERHEMLEKLTELLKKDRK